MNLILGIPFIKSARGVLDFNDDVMEFKSLDAPPFPLRHNVARLSVPSLGDPAAVNHGHAEWIGKMCELDNVVARVFATLDPSSSTHESTEPSLRLRLKPPSSHSPFDGLSDDTTTSSDITGSNNRTNPLEGCLASNNSLDDYSGPFEGVQDIP